jgi:uncharacterized membrane protein YedE/YeeE
MTIFPFGAERLSHVCERPQKDFAMAQFTPLSAAIGGILIGLSSALLMLLAGRIAGISGIFGSLVSWQAQERGWRLGFVAGLVAAPVLAALAGYALLAPPMPGWTTIVAAGLLTGFGTRLGGGCTSGHGICGNARLSPRSMAATALFMLAGFLTVFLVRHVIGGG